MIEPQDSHAPPRSANPISAPTSGISRDQSPPEGDRQPTPATDAALAQSFAHGRHQAQAIAEMCLIAGHPQRTAEFLASGWSEAQVRRALLDVRADQPEIASRITADASTSHLPQNSPVVAAVKKLNHKE